MERRNRSGRQWTRRAFVAVLLLCLLGPLGELIHTAAHAEEVEHSHGAPGPGEVWHYRPQALQELLDSQRPVRAEESARPSTGASTPPPADADVCRLPFGEERRVPWRHELSLDRGRSPPDRG